MTPTPIFRLLLVMTSNLLNSIQLIKQQNSQETKKCQMLRVVGSECATQFHKFAQKYGAIICKSAHFVFNHPQCCN